MRTYLDCIPCFMGQSLRAGRMATNSDKKIKTLLDEIGDTIKHIPMDYTPAQNGEIIYRKITEITGVYDPYKKIKELSIIEAKSMYDDLKQRIKKSQNPLETAVRIAIAGNVIDFGMNNEFDLKKGVETILKQEFAFFDFQDFVEGIEKANCILYIGDNAGESVFDKLLIETIGKKTKYIVRKIPVINDVTYEDAVNSGLNEVAEIISSGCSAPGTILNLCNSEFVNLFNNANVIISKGQGNYEGLSEVKRQVFFLLKAKCPVIARDLNVPLNSIILKKNNFFYNLTRIIHK